MHSLRIGTPARLYTLFAIAAVAAVAPFAHVFGDLYNIWNLKPEYSYGVILPVLSAVIIWRQRAQLRAMDFTGSWTGLALIASGLVLRYIGAATTMHTLEHYAFLFVLYGLVLSLTGPVTFRRLWMPLIILIFAVPLPSFFNNALSLQLQLLSSQVGVWVIRAAGISVLLEGNIIDLGNYQLEVAEACSGLRYLFPLMTLSFIAACMFRGPLWKRAVIFLCSVPITVIMNSVRIGFIGITVEHWGPRMAEGLLHDFEGWLVFMLSTGAMVLVAFGLSRVGRSKVPWSQAFHTSIPQVSQDKIAPATTGSGRAVPRSFIAALVLVLIGAAASAAAPAPTSSAPARQSFADFPTQIDDWVGRRDALQRFYLDILQLDDYILVDFSDNRGPPVNFYSAWYQAQEDNRAIHSPHDCIPGGGWEILKLEQRMMPATPTTRAFPVNRALIQLGEHRQIVYYWFDERGRKITHEYVARWYLFWDALTRHRTDGALVRFTAALPSGAGAAAAEAQADARILKLAARIEPMLNRYVPD